MPAPILPPETDRMFAQWQSAKRARDYATADRLREELRQLGVDAEQRWDELNGRDGRPSRGPVGHGTPLPMPAPILPPMLPGALPGRAAMPVFLPGVPGFQGLPVGSQDEKEALRRVLDLCAEQYAQRTLTAQELKAPSAGQDEEVDYGSEAWFLDPTRGFKS